MTFGLNRWSRQSIDKHARLREQSRGRGTGTRIPPGALGPAAGWQAPDYIGQGRKGAKIRS